MHPQPWSSTADVWSLPAKPPPELGHVSAAENKGLLKRRDPSFHPRSLGSQRQLWELVGPAALGTLCSRADPDFGGRGDRLSSLAAPRWPLSSLNCTRGAGAKHHHLCDRVGWAQAGEEV